MSVEEVTALDVICDGCGKGWVELVGQEKPQFAGSVRRVTDGGSTGEVEWNACLNDLCLARAPLSALNRALLRNDA